jgi:hypothetical protein
MSSPNKICRSKSSKEAKSESKGKAFMRRHRTAAAREVTISILWHSRGVRRAKSPHKGTTLFETAPFALSGSRLDRERTEAIGEGPRVRICPSTRRVG